MPSSMTIRVINRTATLTAAILLGCSGGGGSSTAPPPPPATGSLIISLGAPTLSIATGATGTMTVLVTRAGGFAGAVTVSVTGLPAGVTASSNTQTTVGTVTTATLTFTVVSAAAAGTSTVTVSASGAGVSTVNATFALTLTSVTGGANQVSLTWAQCLPGAKPQFVAFQDGVTGAWTRVTGTNDVYSFNIAQPKGGYAFVTTTLGGTAHLTTVFLGTRAEIGAGGAPINLCVTAVPPQRTITGTVTGMAPGEAANVYLGGRPGIASPAFPNFTISTVPDGPHDLVAIRSAGTASAQDRGIIRQSQALANNTNVGTLDMNGTESFGLATATLAIGGAGTGAGIYATSIVFLSGPSCDPAAVTGLSGPATSFLYIGIPDARMRATDMHQVTVFAGGSELSRSTTEVFHSIAGRIINLPTAFSSNTTIAPGTYKRASVSFDLPPEYNLLVGLTLASTSLVRNTVSVTATVGWTGTVVSLLTPNFTGLTGWDDSWAPTTSATANWTLSVSGSNQVAGASLCVAGTTLRTAIRNGQF